MGSLLLVQPPITDPTCGCAALPALSGYIKANSGHSVTCIDANINSISYLMQPKKVRDVLDQASEELTGFKRGNVIRSLPSELRSKRLIDLQLATTLHEKDPIRAAEIFRNPTTFFDFSTYYWATMILQKWLGVLARPEVPGIYMNFGNNEYLPNSTYFKKIKRLLHPETLRIIIGPFADYIRNRLMSTLRTHEFDVVGLTVGYWSQLPFAVQICRSIRTAFPHIYTLLGGPCITQLWKYGQKTGAANSVLDHVDLFVVGDGEGAIIDVLDSAEDEKPFQNIPNVVNQVNLNHFVSFKYVDLALLPPPAVEDLPLSSYLTPEPFVHYAPTRGCYWNRCTFCDYGPSQESPTAPYRERPIDAVIDDIQHISHFSRFIYFSVDSISPSFLAKIANNILERGLDVRWGAEVRLDMPVNKNYFKTLRNSGCVGVSVGFESANERILKLMDKGTQIDKMEAQIRALTEAGIGVQIMGFTGFPTETFDEALESVNFLEKMRNYYVFGGLGTFSLTAGALVAKKPTEYGLRNLRFSPEYDLRLLVEYDETAPSKTSEEKERIRELSYSLTLSKDRLRLNRPFLGGIDTAHTLMYLNHYSLTVKDELNKVELRESADENQLIGLKGVIADWWPPTSQKDVRQQDDEEDEHYLICDDGSVFSCGDDVANVAKILTNSTPLRVVLQRVFKKPGPEKIALIYSFEKLRELGLVIAVPTFSLEENIG